MENIKYRITHIGPLPPPIGGISVYLYRLSKLNSEIEVIDERLIGKIKFFTFFLMKKRHFIYHSSNLKRQLFLGFICSVTDNKLTIVSHGDALIDKYKYAGKFKKHVIINLLKNVDGIQVVNSKIKSFILSITDINPQKIKIEQPFLPPPLEEEIQIINTYDIDLFDFIKGHSPIVIANAYKLVFYEGIDLYGLDMCVELINSLKGQYPKIGMIFALAEIGDNEYYLKIKQKIKEYNIEDNFYIMTGQKELWPIFKSADLMVRPTYIDGYGISIAEALYFGCPAVASDVCDRAIGTVTFRNRDLTDFFRKCNDVLKEKKYRFKGRNTK